MRAKEARLFKEQVEEDKKTTLDDLTRGVVNYKMLGLDFVRTDVDGRLRFAFTKLDEDDPSREFSFLLIVDEDDKYDIMDCDPDIPAAKLEGVLDELNQTEDMSALARSMSKSIDSCSSSSRPRWGFFPWLSDAFVPLLFTMFAGRLFKDTCH